MKSKVFLISLMLMCSGWLHAQKVSISTNLLGYAELGTMNVDVSYGLSRKWSLLAGARYNPFTFNKGDAQRQFQYRQQSYSLGARFWPWHIWSGWWFSAKMRYQEYNMGGVISRKTSEGDRFGMGVYSGYTMMLSRHFNLEFGVGLWGGMDIYRKYSCPVCGLTEEQGKRGFVLPDDLMISVVYVF